MFVVCGVGGVPPFFFFSRQPENSKSAHLRVWRFKHHQNSTKGLAREGRKKENCGGRGKEEAEILGPPTLRGPTVRGCTFRRHVGKQVTVEQVDIVTGPNRKVGPEQVWLKQVWPKQVNLA